MPRRLKDIISTAVRAAALRRRLVLFIVAYTLVSGVLIGVFFEQRGEVIANGLKVLSAFAQLTEDQTTRTIQNVEQTLEIAEARMASAAGSGSAGSETIRAAFRELLASRPYLMQITVLDRHGRTVYTSADGEPGLDLSDRAYFIHHRDFPGSGFTLGLPVRSRSTAQWLIPATRALVQADGEFAGIIVASVDPVFFSRAWVADEAIKDQATALWRIDGTGLVRSPFDERFMGAAPIRGMLLSRMEAASKVGTLQTVSLIDGRNRLVAYRRLAAYPDFSLSVAQPTELVLAEWRRQAWIVAIVWAVAGAALLLLATGLVRESNARHVSQNRFRMLFDANPFPMVVVERETRRFLAVNDAAIEEYGWSREESLASTADSLYLPQDRPKLTAIRQQDGPDVMRTIKGLRHCKKDGTMIDVEMNSRPIEFGGVPAMLVLTRNVTEHLAAERARLTAEEQLRQSQKMEAVGQLTGGIAHDFNNLLFVILANVETLQEDKILDVARLDEIADAVARAAELTRQLLAFSRKQPLRPQKTDINHLVSGTGKLLRRALGARVEIESILAEDLCVVDVDPAQLEAALVNLCINARDAMPEGGRLLVETSNVSLDTAYVAAHPDVVVGDYAMLAVTDTGKGIPADTLAKVFEPFFTTKEVGKGTGLGLSMVYGFIRQSHGHIRIDSEVGHGTTVRLYLPRVDGKGEDAIAKSTAAMPRGTERIMVVEDNASVLAHVVGQLRSLGYTVAAAPDGATALDHLKTARGRCDLLLTDIVMPGMLDGKALADRVVLLWPGTPVILMSGYTENVAIQQGRLPTGMHLLTKPFHKAELAATVRRMLIPA